METTLSHLDHVAINIKKISNLLKGSNKISGKKRKSKAQEDDHNDEAIDESMIDPKIQSLNLYRKNIYLKLLEYSQIFVYLLDTNFQYPLLLDTILRLTLKLYKTITTYATDLFTNAIKPTKEFKKVVSLVGHTVNVKTYEFIN